MLQRQVDLRPFNTLALPGRAAEYVRVDAAATLADPRWRSRRRFVLGGGSNLVLGGDFDGLILHMAIPGRRLVAEDAQAWYIEAGAGENWHALVLWSLARGWPGLENLALIPGTVGAAPVQNIGAYGVEISDFVQQVRAWDFQAAKFVEFNNAACHFAYRDSLFKKNGQHREGALAIVALTLRLPKSWQPNCRYADVAQELAAHEIATPTAQEIAAAVIAVRQRKLPDPGRLPNAGSFFHNPVVCAEQAAALLRAYPELPTYPQADGRVKLAAGWLIEAAGWKGKALGPVGMYEKQALVLVNHGGATGQDVAQSMAAVQAAVRAQFALELTPEPVFLSAANTA
ncbi:UDP-N-acetylmuramate dehydrogenase [Azonexus sp.]|uniref:UDP-N-acetylmuramate dehydrogenase n=1 Tax=Azonexus sp. TaxID=1872668 RepID=UPI0039E53735